MPNKDRIKKYIHMNEPSPPPFFNQDDVNCYNNIVNIPISLAYIIIIIISIFILSQIVSFLHRPRLVNRNIQTSNRDIIVVVHPDERFNVGSRNNAD